jgi:hypothetical protein
MNKHKTKIPTKATVKPRARVPETKRPAIQLTSRVEKKSVPAAPPVYRPQPVPKVLQKKGVRNLAPNKAGPAVPSAPRIMRASPVRVVRSAAIQRAMAHPGGPPPPGPPPPASAAASAAAAVPCRIHPDILLDEYGDCWECQSDQGRVQQKPNQVKKRAEVTVPMDEWSRDNRKVAGDLLTKLSSTQITHRGNKRPQDERRPTADDLVNHESSGAPVWFTVGVAATGADIEKYAYHHVLTLSTPVNVILSANLGQVLNHSEGSSGESTWSGFMMKTNEAGCFAVSRDKLHEFYRQFVSRHELRSTPKSGRK